MKIETTNEKQTKLETLRQELMTIYESHPIKVIPSDYDQCKRISWNQCETFESIMGESHAYVHKNKD